MELAAARTLTGTRPGDLEWGPELYCMGHLIQAGVARLRSQGEDDLVGAVRRAADHIRREFPASGRGPAAMPVFLPEHRANDRERLGGDAFCDSPMG